MVDLNKKSTKLLNSFNDLIKLPVFLKAYVIGSLILLFATTIFWSLLSAKVQQGNADQLVNTLLFEHSKTFHGALIPGQHTFLLKWPFFLLIRLLGSSPVMITAFTVIIVTITVAAFTYILHKIENRPLVFGTLCLALASVLISIPAQPYAGALLPANMAMISTRNLEYLLYIGSLILITKTPRIKDRNLIFAILGLSILFASDKLFLSLSIAGAFLALIIYSLIKKWHYVSISVNWIITSLVGATLASLILWIINVTHFTNIIGQSSNSPYGLVQNVHSLALGIVYGFFGLLTNFGANPASNYTILRNVPSQTLHGLFSLGGLAIVINAVLFVAAIYAVFVVTRNSFSKIKMQSRFTKSNSLAIMLIWTTVIAAGLFIFTQHDYAVDSRYLTISFFTLFISGAVYLRSRKWLARDVVIVGAIITIGIFLGAFNTLHFYHEDSSAVKDVNQRDSQIAEILNHHQIDTLIGDYWRVIPTKLITKSSFNVMPLASCTDPRNTLTSLAWQTNLTKHSFAYLISFDKSLTDYPTCNVNQVIKQYGKPNSSTLIEGSLSKPTELLLFYDNGIQTKKPAPVTYNPQLLATIFPINLSGLLNTVCPKPTVMNIVAHQDDDLLFMSPDLLNSIANKDCIRTVYLTAGDAGTGKFYWLAREQGAEAAYSQMIGYKGIWIQKIVQISKNEFVTIANPKHNTEISLIFMHLPDGNLKGEGFQSNHYQSLQALEQSKIKTINSVDGQSYYSLPQLTSAITTIMHVYQPSEIRTQASYLSTTFPDHVDHIAVGRLVKTAYTHYEQQQYAGQVIIPLTYYIGYPIRDFPVNVSGTLLDHKVDAYLEYAKHDTAVCQSIGQCNSNSTFGFYLYRQYKKPQ